MTQGSGQCKTGCRFDTAASKTGWARGDLLRKGILQYVQASSLSSGVREERTAELTDETDASVGHAQ